MFRDRSSVVIYLSPNNSDMIEGRIGNISQDNT